MCRKPSVLTVRTRSSPGRALQRATASCLVTCNQRYDMATAARSASRDKVRAHRTRLREQGLRPVQLWVTDVRSQTFVRAAHRQSAAVARSPQAHDDQAFVDAIAAWDAE